MKFLRWRDWQIPHPGQNPLTTYAQFNAHSVAFLLYRVHKKT
jgi:hypothetical protein